VAPRGRDVAVPGAGDGRGHRPHDRAELAEVVPAEHRLGPLDGLPGLARAGRGTDHRAEHAVQQVLGHYRVTGQRERPVQQLPGPGVVAVRRPDLGQPLERVRLASGRPDVPVPGGGLGQLGGREVQVTGQQRRLSG
jgi:hypothetical protein